MEFINLILHLDKYLAEVIVNYHNYFYLLFFLVIFAETGLVVTPFLPGDSLLFIAGGFAASGHLNIYWLMIIIFLAAFGGDNVNFFVGKLLGERLFKNPNSKIFRRDLLIKTHNFYEIHGRRTIVIARFIPLVRTFAPFVAGVGYMPYPRFIGFSILGSFLWILILLGGGYLFGNIPFVKEHLSIVIMLVMIVSVIPIIKMVIDELKTKKI